MLALADQCRAAQHDGQQGHVVDEFHHRSEPGLVQIGIEADGPHQVYRRCARGAIALHEFIDFGGEDLCYEAVARECLADQRGIHIELGLRHAPGQHVALEVGWNVEDERVLAVVKARVHLGHSHEDRGLEVRRIKTRHDARRQRRRILVDDGNRGVVQALGHGRGGDIDRHGERVDDQHQHGRVPHQAPEFLDAEAPNIGSADHGVRPPAF